MKFFLECLSCWNQSISACGMNISRRTIGGQQCPTFYICSLLLPTWSCFLSWWVIENSLNGSTLIKKFYGMILRYQGRKKFVSLTGAGTLTRTFLHICLMSSFGSQSAPQHIQCVTTTPLDISAFEMRISWIHVGESVCQSVSQVSDVFEISSTVALYLGHSPSASSV